MKWEDMSWKEKINFLNAEADKILKNVENFSDEQIERLVDKIDELLDQDTVEILEKAYYDLLGILIIRGLGRQIDNNELSLEELMELKNSLEKEAK